MLIQRGHDAMRFQHNVLRLAGINPHADSPVAKPSAGEPGYNILETGKAFIQLVLEDEVKIARESKLRMWWRPKSGYSLSKLRTVSTEMVPCVNFWETRYDHEVMVTKIGFRLSQGDMCSSVVFVQTDKLRASYYDSQKRQLFRVAVDWSPCLTNLKEYFKAVDCDIRCQRKEVFL